MMNFSPFRANFSLLAALILSTFLLAIPESATAGQCLKSKVVDRPKIGLVLGGGGARGYAHVGVLKKLEELRIPYDFVTGTSMGSIVGGLLATGMESDELARVVREADWDDLFSDKTQREDLPFRRKTEDNLGLFGPKLGIGKDSDLLPKGVVSGQKIVFMFESVVSQRVNTSDFNNLPIPFRAIATDIISGDMVVIGEGELSMAMRASMAVPGVFDPVRREGALLVDGGLVRNLPVDVAKDMGAEVVIAVDVGTKLAGEEEMTNALAIIYQMSGLLTVHNTDIQIDAMKNEDILVSPAIGDLISSADFSKLDEAIPLGYAAAEAVENQLRRFSLSQSEYEAWRRQIDSCVEGPPQVHFVQLNNQSRFSDDVIMEMVKVKPGESLDLEQLNHDLRQIYGLGFIRQARYSVIEQEGQQGIEITVFQDERGTDFIETGLDLSFSARGTTVNLRGAYLKTDLDERGAEFRGMVQVGESPGIFVDYFKPLDDRLRWSLHPSASYFSRPLYLYDQEGDAVAEVELDEFGGAFAISREFSRYARATAGFTRYTGNLDITVGDPDVKPFSFDGAELYLDLEYDRLDDRFLPTRGMYSNLKYTDSTEGLGADLDFDQLEFSIFGSHTIGRHNFMLGGRYNTSLDKDIPIYGLYTGGGFLNMSGFEANSLIGPHFGMLLAGYRYQVAQSGFLPGYVGTTLEYGNAVEDREDIFSDGLINGSVYFSYSTPLGPVYIGVGWSEERSAIYFLSLGNIFGPQSLGRR
ncbi:MAG: patatin-like phospholipase family protein [Gammaproteobacteria bacterium]|nr:patatin-like phospholipase family protein [Gammaproteobacteria bacterium]